jgi:ribonuclease HII
MSLLIGIDDAGRGPVIGPMVLAGVLIDENEEIELSKLGAKDSKLLEPNKRRQIKDKIIDRFKYHLETTSPKEIDDSFNLNYLEAIKAAMIVNKLTTDISSKVKVIIDCPSVNIEKWCLDVKKLLKNPERIDLHCEHKADFNHPVVGAASIIAKEKREEEMYKLRTLFDEDIGSGYPSDPKTIKFIKENYDKPRYKEIIRFSWKTVKKLIEEPKQKKLF